MKKRRIAKQFLELLQSVPNVSLACEKLEISRNSIYTWRAKDADFEREMDEALSRGVESVNDLAESKLVGKIKAGEFRPIKYWLDNHKKEYIRPRPQNFWESQLATEISKISVEIVNPRNEIEFVDFSEKCAKEKPDEMM